MTRILRRIAVEVYGQEKAKDIWQRIDLIGDIAVIKIPFTMTPKELKPLAEKIIEKLKYVKSVWAAASPVEGEYRLRNLVHLAGEDRTETLYREHGCTFIIDISKVYVSPRLSYEHYRIATLVEEGERVINMYAGAGFFSIIMAKYAKPSKIYSIDINNDAFYYMYRSIQLNKVDDIVVPLLGDATILLPAHFKSYADRILMPLPEKALEHLPYAITALSPYGQRILHIYLHIGTVKGQDPLITAEEIVSNRLRELGYGSLVLNKRVVREIGPRRYQIVLDLRVI